MYENTSTNSIAAVDKRQEDAAGRGSPAIGSVLFLHAGGRRGGENGGNDRACGQHRLQLGQQTSHLQPLPLLAQAQDPGPQHFWFRRSTAQVAHCSLAISRY
jgi:hypothetical protein